MTTRSEISRFAWKADSVTMAMTSGASTSGGMAATFVSSGEKRSTGGHDEDVGQHDDVDEGEGEVEVKLGVHHGGTGLDADDVEEAQDDRHRPAAGNGEDEGGHEHAAVGRVVGRFGSDDAADVAGAEGFHRAGLRLPRLPRRPASERAWGRGPAWRPMNTPMSDERVMSHLWRSASRMPLATSRLPSFSISLSRSLATGVLLITRSAISGMANSPTTTGTMLMPS